MTLGDYILNIKNGFDTELREVNAKIAGVQATLPEHGKAGFPPRDTANLLLSLNGRREGLEKAIEIFVLEAGKFVDELTPEEIAFANALNKEESDGD